jgi:hypothetical protein
MLWEFTRPPVPRGPRRAKLGVHLARVCVSVAILLISTVCITVDAAWACQDPPDDETISAQPPLVTVVTPIRDSYKKPLRPNLNNHSFSSARLHEDILGPGREKHQGFMWKNALAETFFFLSVEHVYRVFGMPDSKPELGGPVFRDYFRSVANLHGWDDKDPFQIQYVGHSLQGEVAAHIEIQNDPRGRYMHWGSGGYWGSRLRAMAYAAAYGAQFKIGPLSEAMIGNVGLPNQYRQRPVTEDSENGRMALSEFFVDPIGGFALTIVEDLMEHYVVSKFERKGPHWARLARTFFCPTRSVANLGRFRWTWYRDGRPVGTRDTDPLFFPEGYKPGGFHDR